ncbi:MAG: RdgB/HAM1 family non-canonical purine NTP pyrophosphatase [Acidimicrobiia bacterium]
MIPRLVIASKNKDKIAEIEAVLTEAGLADAVVRGLDWPEVDETGATLEENALLKARSVAGFTGLPALGDDTGLEVVALAGRPGVHTARYAGESATYEENYTKLLGDLNGIDDRRAWFRTVVALVFPDGSEVVASGQIDGVITREPRGESGFGYDPVFEVDGFTFSEMADGEKNSMSHRARALRALLAQSGL